MEEIAKSEEEEESSFAKRLITGQAAEQYFRDNFSAIDVFKGYDIQDTTKMGCGFDFKLASEEKKCYFGVEVKGLSEIRGNIILTNKEHMAANFLKDRYFIFVVKNLKENPSHNIYQDPLVNMNFKRVENTVMQINWNASIL
ncbi:MAG: DUF3883 domain-containing protein [Sulfurospirillaceae bacterium]|nr:DUF3883 domain-containing protein [Sulfurospirillaceae bacterium]MDD3463060.1 DUF3883 domain-containing protein [Sulfurospirillaceae bacterium]